MARKLSGEASESESRELQELLQKRPDLQQQFELLTQLWKPRPDLQQEEENPAMVSRILQLSAMKQSEESVVEEVDVANARPRRLRHFLRYAAAVALLASIGWSVMHFPGRKKQGEIVSVNGSRTRAILPDGSTVWLNAGSRISYAPDFNETTREVVLDGEAYFDVKKQPDRPFIVHAASIDIRVLGTAFNVKSYPEDNTVETTLIRGLVQINQKNRKEPIYLRPHQKVVLPATASAAPRPARPVEPVKEGKIVAAISNLDTTLREDEYVETAWIFNRLEFRGDRFTELARKLERWYNVTIHFRDEQARELQFNGSLENETVEQALIALQTAVPFNFTIKGNEIFIGSQEKALP